MNLAKKARKATGLDIESFAKLLGVHWRELARYEEGRAFESPLHEALFTIVAQEPSAARKALESANKAESNLKGCIVRAVLKLGKGPKRTVSLQVLKSALRFGKEGLKPFAGYSDDGVKEALYELDRIGHIELQAAVDPSSLNKLEKDACIRDAKRGFLAFAAPGPKLPRRKPQQGPPR
ncbi:MAG TPA: hypothetical protein DEA08_31755 [Planctomycetes bacterium]|nr:hypothetical protein [Planctomycetota bacterium]